MADTCVFCGATVEVPANRRPSRSDSCLSCGRDLKCCKQCSFYDVAAYNECRETSAERVVDKEKSNYCDYFQFHNREGEEKRDESWRDELEDLFK